MSPYILVSLICLIIIPKCINSIEYDSCINCEPIRLDRDVRFYLYTRKNSDAPYILQYENETSLNNSPLDIRDQTIIFIHGFGESALQPSCQTISTAYLTRNDYNIICVDWSSHAAMPTYLTAARNVKVVGPHVAKLLIWLENKNVILISKINVIGFSLGAHVAGFMAKELEPQKVGRITGLDPAGPFFEHAPASDRLDKSDAVFVDIIHTNSKIPGMEFPIGHVDFYPNRGFSQPGCNFPDIVCGHRRAWAYYAESVLNEYGFPASKCLTWKPSITNCTQSPDGFMGFAVDHQTEGIFLLRTNAKSPFARNMTDYHDNNE